MIASRHHRQRRRISNGQRQFRPFEDMADLARHQRRWPARWQRGFRRENGIAKRCFHHPRFQAAAPAQRFAGRREQRKPRSPGDSGQPGRYGGAPADDIDQIGASGICGGDRAIKDLGVKAQRAAIGQQRHCAHLHEIGVAAHLRRQQATIDDIAGRHVPHHQLAGQAVAICREDIAPVCRPGSDLDASPDRLNDDARF